MPPVSPGKFCFVHILRCTLPNDRLNVRNLLAQRNRLFRGAKFLGKRRLSCILYTINGDGAADGQTAQDDVFLYYPRSTAKELLAARAEEDPSVLDRMEMTPGVLVTAQEADYKSDLPETTPAGEGTTSGGVDPAQNLQLSAAPRSARWLLIMVSVLLAAVVAAFIMHRRHELGLDTRRPWAERVLAIFAALYAQLVRRGLPADTPSDDRAFTQFLQKQVHELSGEESRAMVSLAQRAAFAADNPYRAGYDRHVRVV